MTRNILFAAYAALLPCASVSDPPVQVDVVVVGAGYSGLSAARDLQAAGLRVAIFDANDRPGGRTLNRNLTDAGIGSGVVELGGEWLDERTNQPYAWELIIDELGFDVEYTAYGKGDGLLYTSNGRTHFDSSDPFGSFDLGPRASLELALAVEEATVQKSMLPHGQEHLDAMTFEDWIQNRHMSDDANGFLRFSVLSEDAHEPSELSALGAVKGLAAGLGDSVKGLAAWRSKGARRQPRDAQSYRVKGGMAAPALVMANSLGSALHLSSPVTAISQDGTGALVRAQDTKRGGAVEVRARRVLFSGTPSTTLNITFTPPLPQEKQELFKRMPVGNCLKASLVYSRPFWRERNLSGMILNVVDQDNRPSFCVDNSPLDGSLGILLCLAEGKFAASFVLRSEKERRDLVANFLARSFGEDAMKPMYYADHDWAAEPYIGGSYWGSWLPGVETHWAQFLKQDFRNVSWIGSDVVADDAKKGFVNAAIMSGREAAKRLISELVNSRLDQLVVSSV